MKWETSSGLTDEVECHRDGEVGVYACEAGRMRPVHRTATLRDGRRMAADRNLAAIEGAATG